MIRRTGEGPPRRPLASRLFPIMVMAVAVVAVVAAVISSGTTTTASSSGSTAPTTPAAGSLELPKGVVPWDPAKATSINWGKRCDTKIGKLAIPIFPRQPCFGPFTGDNGGDTGTGVSRTAIKVVVYLPQPNDAVLKFIYAQIQNDNTVDQQWQTYQDLVAMYSKYYEMYGRKIDLVRFNATGPISDPVAATADAESIANDIKPFLVIGGPLLTNAFSDTLASNKVMCVSCGPGQPNDYYEQRSPYVWDLGKNAEQNQLMIAEYIGKRLAGGKALHAGADLVGKPRVFGYVHVNASDNDALLQQRFTDNLQKNYGVTFADIESYKLPTDLVSSGRDLITKLKEQGVTTVVFAGDPLAPQTLTKIATQQQYFPEWVITGTVLVDTAAFARSYDQEQWQHAFGPSNLYARISPTKAGAAYLYNWYYGHPAPADKSIEVINPNMSFLFGPLQAAGPDLNVARFRDVLFNSPIVPSTAITPQISFGNRGVWPRLDMTAVDDQTEVWWDAKAQGLDEISRQGTGLWRYVNGGKRYLPGQWPKGEPDVFDPKNSVTILDEPPDAARISADYVPLK